MRTLIAAGILVSTLGSASAQDYPSRTITLIVPFPAGGPTDTVARVTANAMSRALGQSIVVENVAGAGGTIGAGRVARAEPDGYSLLIHHVGLATAATLYRKLAYDTRTAFAPIGLTTDAPMVFVGRSNLEPNSLQELVAYARARGKNFMFASAGLGSASNLCGLMFMAAIKQELSNVPYKGGGPLMNDLIGKQIDLGCEQATTATEPVKGKLVKAYAVTTKTRLASLPELPTADEAGLNGFEVNVWHGIFAPKDTPAAVVQKLSAALKAAVKDPEVMK
ncbi:MAG TPA: tripartite tricarboxylate transporter substrate-binding protein, partial [Lacipirellulaceae bacterium]|nr:tripartite tricarboxylate transporter substrate-binding protein [Lacipirellulaceae bacterium]